MNPLCKVSSQMNSEPERRPIVLAVDDAPEMLSLITEILEGAGMTALVARSGKSALSLLTHVTPDVILMDAAMPEMDGFETCEAIKQDRGNGHIPLIFMTGFSDTEHVVKGFAAGGVDYITKPVNPDELTARIRAHLANSRMTQSARMALDISGTPLVAVDLRGAILWITPQASALFRQALSPDKSLEQLAPSLATLVEQKAVKADLAEGLSQAVVATYIGETAPGEHLLRLSSGDTSRDLELLRSRLDLTKRETEVLLWITQGKSNKDVAEILDCSPRTVNKHLEQIYAKLSVENRTAAAMLAVRVLMDV